MSKILIDAVTRIAKELEHYSPKADAYNGEHIHKLWSRELRAALTICRKVLAEEEEMQRRIQKARQEEAPYEGSPLQRMRELECVIIDLKRECKDLLLDKHMADKAIERLHADDKRQCECIAELEAELGQYPEIQAMLMTKCKELGAENAALKQETNA